MPRRKAADASKHDKDEHGNEPVRRLNVRISESAYETLVAHVVRLRRPIGVLVSDSIEATLTEFRIHSRESGR